MRLELRDLEILSALARFQHFTRAAEAVGISQPALSSRIANMEAAVGMPLVRRGARFGGFTEEGDILLKWARRILSENEAMLAEMTSARGEVAGRVALGVIPTALAFGARLAAAIRARHPRVRPVIRSASAGEIEAGLGTGAFDIGISYLEAPPGAPRQHHARAQAMVLYSESYVVLAPRALVPEGAREMTWREAAELPLALLTPNMRNRQIVEEAFRRAGVEPRPVFETDDLLTLFAFVSQAGVATVAPEMAADARGLGPEFTACGLVAPVLTRTVAAITPDTGFQPPAVGAVLRIASDLAAAGRPATRAAGAPAEALPEG